MAEQERPQLPPADQRWPDVFSAVDTVIAQLIRWINEAEIPDVPTHLAHVKAAALFRVFNQYRAIVGLLRNYHWEDALKNAGAL